MTQVTQITREQQHALCISDAVTTMQLGKVMGPAYKRIMNELEKQNIPLDDKAIPFTIYHRIDWESFDKKGPVSMFKMLFLKKWHIDMGIPVPPEAHGVYDIRMLRIEGGTFLCTVHSGPYQKVGEAYERIRSKAKSEGLTLASSSMEYYLNDPREVKPTELKTEVLVPLRQS